MDLLPLRAAAGGGSIDGHPAAALVAAGFTLLQRSAVLVRALAGKRSAILLPASPQVLVALAASDGRGAVLLDPLAAPFEVAGAVLDAKVGAVLTVASLADRLPPGLVQVRLDDAPVSATVIATDGTSARIDLGTHFGLELEGDADAPGRDEECLVVRRSGSAAPSPWTSLSHRELIDDALHQGSAFAFNGDDRILAALPFSQSSSLTAGCIAPLLAGAAVRTAERLLRSGGEAGRPHARPIEDRALEQKRLVEGIVADRITVFVAAPDAFEQLLTAVERSGGLDGHLLRAGLCVGASASAPLRARWAALTGTQLRNVPSTLRG